MLSQHLREWVFAEIKANNLLDTKNRFSGYYSRLTAAIKANPQGFPVTSALTSAQQNVIYEQLNCVTTAHQFFSDHNINTIRFLNNPCSF